MIFLKPSCERDEAPIVAEALGQSPAGPYLKTSLCAKYVKDESSISPLPVDLAVLKQRITTAIDGLDSDTLTRVWVEMDYRLIMCRANKGSHIEHL
ncbi:hypothetical protein TNCV_95421 [Trichonephila clavipes]|nr:hypothetical protein TNCV_95421 [Trichonephila clavipes]